MATRHELVGDVKRIRGLLARGERSDVQEARRLAASLDRALTARRPPPAPEPDADAPEQLGIELRFVTSDTRVEECPLGCPISALHCTARQIQAQLEREGGGSRFANDPRRRRDRPDRPPELARHDTKRGSRASRPSCASCPVGAVVRALHGDTPEAIEMARRAPRASDTAET